MNPRSTLPPTGASPPDARDGSPPFVGSISWDDVHFRSLVERNRDLICLHAPDGRYRYVSPSALAMLGYPPESLVGANPYDFFHPEQDVELLRSSHERVLAGRVDDTVRYRFRHRDGHYIWLETLAVPLYEDTADPLRLTAMLTSSRDVSAQVESEALRATSDERLRLALLATGTGVFDVRLPAQTGWFSDEYAMIFGYDAGTRPLFAAGWQPLVHADDLPMFLDARRGVLSGATTGYRLDVRRMHRDGQYRWMRVMAHVAEADAAGLPLRVVGTLQDVDERVRSSQALLESQRRLARSQQMARVGDWRTDVDDPRDRWSDEVYRILGLDPLTTVPSFEVFLSRVHPDDREVVREGDAAALRDGTDYECDIRVIRPDGELRHVYGRTGVLRNAAGQVTGLFGTKQDITERKQAEAALRSTAAALEHAQRLARVGSWHWQIDGDRVQWSRALYEIFGRDPTLPPPPYAEQANLYTPQSGQARRALVLRSLKSGEPFEIEVEFLRADGTSGWGVSRGEVLHDAGGRAIGMSGTLQDITERKHTEIALREARDQVRELSGHLEDELNQERKRIALDVHDELGQMLTAMKLHLDVLQSQLANPEQTRRTSERMRELIEETMEVTRNVALNLRPPALDLGLAAALEWLAEDFGLRTDIDCRVESPAAEMTLDDKQATALFRIAQESLTNVTRHAHARHVRMALTPLGGVLQLEIRDDGVGFDAAAQRPGGHFGLLGMRERALRLGAELDIESQPGAGCAVRVRVRLQREAEPAA
jgi:PAS domain S-box-containing protein